MQPKETHIQAGARLQQDHALRAADLVQNTAKFCSKPPEPEAFQELGDLAQASFKRATAMQASWIRAWGDWAAFSSSIQGADTVPKYFDRLFNIVLQAEAQLATQAQEATELMDNVGVSYAHWLAQKVEDKEN
ncbi:MAG: hypothetical protein AAF841_14465 [Pseudomonadota bacterium]